MLVVNCTSKNPIPISDLSGLGACGPQGLGLKAFELGALGCGGSSLGKYECFALIPLTTVTIVIISTV